jgi:serine/threonine protein kinase
MSRDRNVVEKVIASLRNIGNFELSPLREAEHGGCYRAVDTARRISVAIRTLWPNDFPSPEDNFRKLLLQARSAQTLEHANIAKVIGSGELDGAFFIVSSFSDGRTLRETLASGDRLSPWDLIDFARQTCVGLESAHAHGLVHHAMHPNNVALQFDGSTKILDIGLFRSNDPLTEPFHPNAAYLAPEQFKGAPADRFTNFYSLAVMLYEIAIGKLPFTADSWESLARQAQQELPEPIQFNASLPPGINAAIMKALSQDRAARFQSGPDMVRALEDYKSFGKPAAPSIAPPIPIASRPVAINASAAGVAPAPVRNPYAPSESHISSGIERPSVLDLQEPVQWKPPVTPVPPPAQEVAPEVVVPEPYVPNKKEIAREAALLLAEKAKTNAHNRLKKIDPWIAALSLLGIILATFIGRTIALSFSGTSHATTTVQQEPAVPAPASESAPAQAQVPAPDAVVALPAPATPVAAAIAEVVSLAPELPHISRKPDHRAARKLPNTRPVVVNATLPALTTSNAPGTGSVMLATVPAGAQVLVDGKSNQSFSTPQTIFSLTPGVHTLAISKDGYTTAARSVQITAGAQSNLSVQLELPSGLVNVISNPTTAYILIDGVSTGHVTPSQVSVAPGNHTITLRRMGYLDATDSFTVKSGEQLSRTMALLEAGSTSEIKVAQTTGVRKIFGNKVSGVRLTVKTNPPGASVLINGQTVVKSTPVDFGLNPGNYVMEIQLMGYQSIRRTISVQAGAPQSFDLTLQE